MNNDKQSGGIGFLGTLQIMFIGLKLTDLIDWHWWWVVSPLWVSFILAFILVLSTEINNILKGK